MTTKYYTVQTFGCDCVKYPRYSRNEDLMCCAAQKAKGSGTCTCARVYEHDTLALAKSADISRIRDGERVVFEA